MALSHSLRRKHAQVAAAKRWADPETFQRLQAEFEREAATEAVRQYTLTLPEAVVAGIDLALAGGPR